MFLQAISRAHARISLFAVASAPIKTGWRVGGSWLLSLAIIPSLILPAPLLAASVSPLSIESGLSPKATPKAKQNAGPPSSQAAPTAVSAPTATQSIPVESKGGTLNLAATANDSDLPWTLEADKLVAIDDGVIMEASGGVVLVRGQDYLKADFARYFTATGWVYVSGNVSVRLGRDELKASEAEFDLANSTGWLKDGSIFMAGPHIYFRGDNVIKHWGDRYTFQQAKVTACDGPVPAWSVGAEEAVVELDGYATLSHTTMNIKDKGIFYTPFLVLPAKTTRQSGLLQADAGISSKLGAYVTIPWYQVLDQSRDMTFYATFMQRHGLMPSVEYRSYTSDNDKTWLAIDALYDMKRVRRDADDPVDDRDGLLRTNRERFWLRGMGQGEIASSDWHYKYNLDYVSDQNFLREFKSRMTGYDASRDALFDFFGRTLTEMDQNRITAGYIYRTWERFALTFGGRYEQNPALGHGNASPSTDTTPQRLPEVNAYLFKGRILPDMPLEIEAASNASYIYRTVGTSGGRFEFHPRLSIPLDLKYATVIATGGLRQTFYTSTRTRGTSLITSANNPWKPQDGWRRTIPDFDITAFTQASRVWDLAPEKKTTDLSEVGQVQWTALRHMFQPRLRYSWVPNVPQERNPFYIEEDRIQPMNELSLSLTNLFTARRQSVVADAAPSGQSPTTASLLTDYYEVARVRLGLGYDIGEASRNRNLKLFPRRPITDLTLDISYAPLPNLNLWAQSSLSMYGKGFTRNDVGLTLINDRWGAASFGYSSRNRYYDYRRQAQRENPLDIQLSSHLNLLRSEILFTPSPQWHVNFINDINLDTGRNYENGLRLTYIDQCYQISGRFTLKGREKSFQLSISLLGIN